MAKGFGHAVVLLVVIFTSSRFLPAQEEKNEQQTKEEPQFTLTFSDTTASKDGDAALPVFFTRESGAPDVTEVRVRLTYPNSNLKYKNVEVAELARSVGLDVKAQEGEATGDQVALDMVFSLPKAAQHDFPSGQLATVNFRFADPTPGVSVTLRAELWIDGKLVSGEKSLARVQDAYIEVAPVRVYLNCFFFTH